MSGFITRCVVDILWFWKYFDDDVLDFQTELWCRYFSGNCLGYFWKIGHFSQSSGHPDDSVVFVYEMLVLCFWQTYHHNNWLFFDHGVHETLFTTRHSICKLRMGSISLSVCPWQASPAELNVKLQLIGPFRKLRRKWIVVNTVPHVLLTTLHFLHNLLTGSISYSVCP
jgi:hypothetical protein